MFLDPLACVQFAGFPANRRIWSGDETEKNACEVLHFSQMSSISLYSLLFLNICVNR